MLLFCSPQNDHVLKFLASKQQVSRGIVIYRLKFRNLHFFHLETLLKLNVFMSLVATKSLPCQCLTVLIDL